MDNKLDEFISEVTNLKINIVDSLGNEYLDLSHYNQFDGGVEYQITDLATKINFSEATSYILNLKKIESKFGEFWQWYNILYESFCNGTFSPTKVDFKHDIKRYFNVPNFDESGILTLKFLNDLHDAAMFKHGELTGLINEIQNLIAPKKQTETNTLPRLQTNLTTNQRAKLFTELVKGEFIPNENPDCFNWAIGVTDEKEPTQPGQWQPIEWKKSKEDFVRLFQPILREVSGNEKSISRPHKKIIEALFFDNDNEPMNSLRNPPPKQDSEIETILRTIGIITKQSFRHKLIR